MFYGNEAGSHIIRGQVCHLDLETGEEVERVARALPRMLPDDILLRALRPVPMDFNARFSAVGRRYTYHLLLARDVFTDHLAHTVLRELDREAMDGAAGEIIGRHDFTSFCKTRSLKDAGNGCEVSLCRFHWQPRSAIFEIRADRFLHHMVRNLIGTLLEIGRGRRPADEMPTILAARDRARAGRTAPARGLFLEEVYYPEDLLDAAGAERAGRNPGPAPVV